MTYYIGSVPYAGDYFTHSGIRGMKWGVKNGPPYPLKASQLSKSEKKEKQKSSTTRKEVSDMSDDELRNNVNRMRSDVEYNRLSKELDKHPRTSKLLSTGAKVAGKILSTAGYVTVSTARVTIAPLASNFFREMGTGLGKSMFGSVGGNKGNNGNNGGNNKRHDDEDDD